MSRIRPPRWSGCQTIFSSDGHWTTTFVLQGSFDCPTPHISFDLEHRLKPEKLDHGRIQCPSVQYAREGRWHLYHLTLEGREDEVKATEARQKRLGGTRYSWQTKILLHESRVLNKVLVDKVVKWLLSSTEHQKWFGAHREDRQSKAFFVNKDDWTPVGQLPTVHEMVFIGHPMQRVEDIVEAYKLRTEETKGENDSDYVSTCTCLNGMWCCAEKVFDHGCLLSKVGNIFAIKDDYGFVLVVRER